MSKISTIENDYNFSDNTFISKEKKYDVEIGDSKRTDFVPQLKLMRWDRDCYLSMRYIDNQFGDYAINTEGRIIKWQKGNRELRFYRQSKSDLVNALNFDTEEGGLEFELVLKDKPSSNKIDLSIRTRGLRFLPQPALTKREIDLYNNRLPGGAFRPDNIIDSIAIYHATKKDHILGKTNYATGKFSHIPRPIITDATGKSIWGKWILVDPLKHWQIEIDQEFINTATYPLVIGPTFGYTSVGASTIGGTNNAVGNKAAPASNGDVTKLTFYGKKAFSNKSVKAVVWLQSDLSIITNGVGGTVLVDSSTPQWWDINYGTSPAVTSGTDYYVGAVLESSQISAYYDTDAGNGLVDGNNYSSPTNLSAPLSSTSARCSIYATHTGSGGAAFVPKVMMVT